MKIIGGHKLYTFEETFAKSLKSPTFRKKYEEQLVRHQMAHDLRDLRNAKNISQQALAKKVDMPQSAIARLESGRHTISLTTLYSIAKAFGKEVKLV